ncbi:flagellar hook capping FlgD N-terminal domain-containing protein [Pseudoneobacillus sp. C159]
MGSWVDIAKIPKNYSTFTETFEQKSIMGKDDFLRILTVQLANQDPSSPLQDRDFIAQMATFSSLEQLTNLNTTFSKFMGQQMSQHASVIGKEITWISPETHLPVSGIVEGISINSGIYYYHVKNEKIPINMVYEIKEHVEKPTEVPVEEPVEGPEEGNN